MARKPGQIDINDLYFGVVVEDFNSRNKDDFLMTMNLFNSSRVKLSVAHWVTSDDEFKKEHNFISWCFCDVRGRCEYEFIVTPFPPTENAMKVDTFRMYVEPNAKLLKQMVDSVSVASAKRYLTEYRRLKRKND